MAYQATLSALETHLESLTNPYAVEPVIHKLQEVFENWDHAEAVFNQFREIACSTKTQKILGKLSAELYSSRSELDRNSREEFVAKVNRVSISILETVQKRKEDYSQEHLQLLLEFPGVWRLGNKKTQVLFNALNGGNRNQWKRFVQNTFNGKEFDAYLKTNYPKYSQYHDPQANFIIQIYKERQFRLKASSPVKSEQKQIVQWQSELTEKKKELRNYWLKDENISALLQLVASHVNGETVNAEQKEVADLLCAIVDLSQKLSVQVPQEDALIQALKAANHMRLLRAGTDFIIGNTLELMQDSDQHIEKAKGKEGILVVGNTKAGKSTFAAHLIGTALQKKDGLLQVKNEQEGLPKIGDSYGISQTLHTKAYTADSELMDGMVLLDSGGVNDSRGKDHELSVHLSLDLLIKNVSNIRTVVLVIPFEDFSMSSNGKNALELVLAARERFPELLESSGVHVLVTHAEEKETEDIESGKRFADFAAAARQAVKREKGDENREALSQKLQVWEWLHQLSKDDKMAIFDFTDESGREELIEGYKAGTADLKEGYTPFLLTDYGREKFEKSIEQYLEKWTELMGGYLGIPELIAQQKKKIAEIENIVTTRESVIRGYNSIIDDINKMIDDLKGVQTQCDEEQHNAVMKRIKDGFFNRLESDYKKIAERLEEIGDLYEQINHSIKNVTDADRAISNTRSEIYTAIFGFAGPIGIPMMGISVGFAVAGAPIGLAAVPAAALVLLGYGMYVAYRAINDTREAKEEFKQQVEQMSGGLQSYIDGLEEQKQKIKERIEAEKTNIKRHQETDIPLCEEEIATLKNKTQELGVFFACESKTLKMMGEFSDFVMSLADADAQLTSSYREFNEMFTKLQATSTS